MINAVVITPELNVTVSTGVTNPVWVVSCSRKCIWMGFFPLSIISGEVWIEFTDTDFILDPGLTGFLSSIGGFADNGAQVSYETYLDSSNGEFAKQLLSRVVRILEFLKVELLVVPTQVRLSPQEAHTHSQW